MKARAFKKLFKQVSVIPLKENDIFVVNLKSQKRVTHQQIDQMYEQLRQLIPNNKVMILAHDMDVKIIREE